MVSLFLIQKLLVLSILPFSHVVTSAQPVPKPFPAQFQVRFQTNITTTRRRRTTTRRTTTKTTLSSEEQEGGTDDDANDDDVVVVVLPNSTIPGTLMYDWGLRSQRIDHGAGSFECVHFYHVTDQPCSLIFTSRNMYRILPSNSSNKTKNNNNNNDDDDCCLDLEGIGAPPPDWGQNDTFDGVVFDQEFMAFQWTFSQKLMGRSPFHQLRQVATPGEYSGYPLTFTFPGNNNGVQDYHFDVTSMVVGSPSVDPSVFKLPPGCTERKCSTHTSPSWNKRPKLYQ